MNTEYLITAIAIISAVTFMTRLFPFLVFGKMEKPPESILYLGKYLPPAIICIIIVYSFKAISFTAAPFGLPEIFCSLLVIVLQKIRGNSMLSIFAGTGCYMLITRLI